MSVVSESAFAKSTKLPSRKLIFGNNNSKSQILMCAKSKLWQNPSLSIEQNGFGKNQDQELSIGISQPLDVFGQRKLNQKHSLSTSHSKFSCNIDLECAKSADCEVCMVTASHCSKLEQSTYATQLKLSKSNLDSAQKRYQVGSIALVDVERAP